MESSLAQVIDKSFLNLLNYLNLLNEIEFFEKKYFGIGDKTTKISAADICKYQIGWGKFLISWYESGLKSEKVIIPGAGFEKFQYKKIAQFFFNQYYDLSKNELMLIFSEVVLKIIKLTKDEFKKGRLEVQGAFEWCTLKSGKKWPLAKWIQVNTVAPYNRAIKILQN